MTFGSMQVRPGMEVIGTTGAPIGHVKEAREEDFVIQRAAPGGDVTVPYDKIRALLASQVVLSLGPDQLD
jgi:hypothetical protein